MPRYIIHSDRGLLLDMFSSLALLNTRDKFFFSVMHTQVLNHGRFLLCSALGNTDKLLGLNFIGENFCQNTWRRQNEYNFYPFT